MSYDVFGMYSPLYDLQVEISENLNARTDKNVNEKKGDEKKGDEKKGYEKQ